MIAVSLAVLGCSGERSRPRGPDAEPASPTEHASDPSDAGSTAVEIAPPRAKEPVVLVAGGDIDMGRLRGQVMLQSPERDGLSAFADLFAAADLRFANLESTITDQRGLTQDPANMLVFTAPPAAADALRRSRLDLVSLANNHAWDYGEAGLFETFERLEAAAIPWVGAGRSREEAHAPVVMDRSGQRIAFLAVTQVWNQAMNPHPGKERVADATEADLRAAIAAARALPGVDRVVVSYHGGTEYLDRPLPATRALLIGALDAGADAVIGHHPHVVQRVEIHRGKPIFYSLGNLLMRAVPREPWTEYGMTARLTFPSGAGPIAVSICPHRTSGLEAIPLARDPRAAISGALFRAKFERLLDRGATEDPASAVSMGDVGVDGCAELRPRGA